jgi:phosphomannomutase
MDLDLPTTKNLELWLQGPFDPKTKEAIQKLNPKELVDSFYQTLSFGTAGLRGLMGVGPNRINVYTISFVTQGLANYLKKFAKRDLSVFISYDSRHHSQEFAEVTAKVLAANEIGVYLTKEMRPTPLVSFGCRYKRCDAAIMITASHNPANYNGYKVYWKDGGQVSSPHDRGIMEEFNKITTPSMVKTASNLNHPLIKKVDREIDIAYFETTKELQNFPKENLQEGHTLKIVYTSLHGTGMTLMPQVLALWGFTNIEYVSEQIVPDADFPTVASPNPEEKEALELGIEKLKKANADLLIATDPDADRLGVCVKHDHDVIRLNGNQIACLCLEHVCRALNENHHLPKNAAFIKSIMTTELFKKICQTYHRPCFDVLTGFKYMARKIHEWEQSPTAAHQFIFGAEESYGYLLGTQTRDKDAIIAAALVCEAALDAKRHNKTLLDYLYQLYHKYGFYYEKTFAIKFEESKEGKEKIEHAMQLLRAHPPENVQILEDYQSLLKIDFKNKKEEPIDSLPSAILIFWLAEGSKIIVRPSGTEPKIKVYCNIILKDFENVDQATHLCENKANALLQDLMPRYF